MMLLDVGIVEVLEGVELQNQKEKISQYPLQINNLSLKLKIWGFLFGE